MCRSAIKKSETAENLTSEAFAHPLDFFAISSFNLVNELLLLQQLFFQLPVVLVLLDALKSCCLAEEQAHLLANFLNFLFSRRCLRYCWRFRSLGRVLKIRQAEG